MNVATWSDTNLDRFGRYDALVAGGRAVDSVAVHDASTRLAAAFVDAGVQPGERVVLRLPNGRELVIAFTAALRVGAVPVPLAVTTPDGDLDGVIRDCAPTAFVGTAPGSGTPTALAAVRCRIAAGTAAGSWSEFAGLLAAYEPLAAVVPRDAVDAAVICYTSGSSGRPKGVVYTHGSLSAAHRRGAPGLRATILMALPLGTFGAFLLVGRMTAPWTLVLPDAFDPHAFLADIERYQVTSVPLVPAMGEALLAAAAGRRSRLTSVRYVSITGAHVSASLVERLTRLFPVRPTVGYGMTETGGAVTTSAASSAPGSVGRPVRGAEIRVVDDRGEPVVAGVAGEIVARAPWMSSGYIAARDGTPFADGWVRTGDVGYLDASGDLFVIGRRKDLINQGGVKIAPDAVADVVRTVEGVADCAVIGAPHALLGEAVVACVVVEPGARVTPERIRAKCRASLDPRSTPTRIWFCDELPRTAGGKIAHEVLRERLEQAGEPTRAPLTPALRGLARDRAVTMVRDAIVGEVLTLVGATTASARAPFGELGLDSLRLVQLTDALSDAVGVALPPTLVYAHPTADRLAEAIVDAVEDHAPPSTASTRRALASHEAIAVIGIGCRLPCDIESAEAFWDFLEAGRDAAAPITRWDLRALEAALPAASATLPTAAALLETPDAFDAPFFGLATREAARIDPQQRIALEVVWHAIEHAGYDPYALGGPHTGLFLALAPGGAGDAVLSAPAMAIGRICHTLDFRGPAALVDTSCSSSLYAVHTAVQHLRLGACDVALAGGVHVIGSPRSFVALGALGVLSHDGRCRTFDATAAGYGRGEGAVMLLLKRLTDAEDAGDRVLAVIRGTAANHDGRSASLTAPNGRAQREVIAAALADAGVSASAVDYVEAHGTATPLGDPIEVDAIMAALGERDRPLHLGSAKTNIGHLEAAAGAAGLAKTVLALAHQRIPAHRHLTELSPRLSPFADRIAVSSVTTAWPARDAGVATAGVSSMGLSGTNVHVIVEAASATAPRPEPPIARLLCLSAKSAPALRDYVTRWTRHLEAMPSCVFADACFTAAVGRTPFEHRIAVVARSADDARRRLGEAGRRRPVDGRRRIAFLFSGHGGHERAMGLSLFETEPAFREALQRCAAILKALGEGDLIGRLYQRDVDSDAIEFWQPAITAVQWSLAQSWRRWGVEPAVVVGHSLGECAAACVAGAISIEDALRLAVARGRLLALLPRGAMLAIGADLSTVERAIAGHDGVSVAAINSPRQVVVSGTPDAVAAVAAALPAAVERHELVVGRAAHSPMVEPLLAEWTEVAASCRIQPLATAMVSTVTGAAVSREALMHPDYWRRQLREPVQFAEAITALIADGCDTFVEIGPHPALLGAAQASAAAASRREMTWVASLARGRDAREQMLSALAELWVAGVDPCFGGLDDTGRRRVTVPAYPFQRVDASGGAAAAAPVADHDVPDVEAVVRRTIADILDRGVETLDEHASLLDLGLDSLRLIEVAAAIRRALALPCTPDHVVSHPSAAQLTRFLRAQAGQPTVGVAGAAATLVIIRAEGSRLPLVCIHPSGGEVTAYLRLRALLGDDQPIAAIQSRALADPAREHDTIAAMGAEYAELIRVRYGGGPIALLGWSMGALVTVAVAAELEAHGTAVHLVGMIDPIGADALPATTAEEVSFAIAAAVRDCDANAALPVDLAAIARAAVGTADSVDWEAIAVACAAAGIITPGSLAASRLRVAGELYRRHFELVRRYRAPRIHAPVVCWVAATNTMPIDGDVRRVGGSHFSIVRPPYIDRIAADLLAATEVGRTA